MNGSFELFESITVRGRKTEKMRRVRRSAAERKSLALSLHLLQGRISHTLNADRVDVLFPSQHVVDRETLKAQVQRIEPGGSTALYAGVESGGKQLLNNIESRTERINRVILLSDGLANVGPSSTSALKGLGRSLSRQGVSVTTIGVGEDYNEDLMSGLAEGSDANYYYVQDAEKLPEAMFGKVSHGQGTASFADFLSSSGSSPFARPITLRSVGLRVPRDHANPGSGDRAVA
jgi:Ca-activated chloride channel family protein